MLQIALCKQALWVKGPATDFEGTCFSKTVVAETRVETSSTHERPLGRDKRI